MEILAKEAMTETVWWWYIFLVFGICAIGATIISMSLEAFKAATVFVVIIFISFTLMFCIKGSVPNGKYKYTIDITDQNQYRNLIECGYEFKRLYNNREIYEIIGDEL